MTLVEHLTEFRTRLLRSLFAVAAGAVVVWVFYDPILDLLLDPYCDLQGDEGCKLLQTDPLEGFSTRLTIAGYGGLAIAMPVVLWQIWRFITPGLHPNERRFAVPFVLASLVLFFTGAGLAWWTVPRALDFLQSIGGPNLQPFFSPRPYLSFLVKMMLAFGLGFEFPIALIFLQLAGVVTPARLRSFRRYAIVGIVVFVAVITPSGDPFSLAVLSVPMYVFYEVSILVGRALRR